MSDVHTEHCCLTHGCKYGNVDNECTVVSGEEKQSYPCENCEIDELSSVEKKEAVMKEITFFICSPTYIRNRWFHGPHIGMYLRRTRRVIDDNVVETIDIANVEVDEAHQGKGIFTEYLSVIESLAIWNHLTVYMENILNPKLAEFMFKRGYIRPDKIRDVCVYKKFL